MKKRVACLIGNPNVGKSSLFNMLTGSMQHTGNWTGKTVANEKAIVEYKDTTWELVDLPGTYSLMGESAEEKVASAFVLKNAYDVAIVVADATNLERSMEIILEVLDVTKKVIICLNLIDEAHKRNIIIDDKKLATILKCPIILTSAKEKKGLKELLETMNTYQSSSSYQSKHPECMERFYKYMQNKYHFSIGQSWHILETNSSFQDEVISFYQKMISKEMIRESYHEMNKNIVKDIIIRKGEKEKKEDKIWNFLFSNRLTSIPLLLIFLFIILWLTIYLSNIPSELLFSFFSFLEKPLNNILSFLPSWLLNPLLYGGYRTLYWVVSVMLPPMLIFFPLFSLLEDYGLLPRIAFNLDKPFQKCGSCGKQSLTMCMGLGCNAVGVTGARIMENKKMRLLAILTNVFMPCNGRFPAMISMISMFFIKDSSIVGSLMSALILLGIILLGIALTFFVTWLLNKCLLKEEKPIFILELPSFRKPKIWRTIYFSIKEKALHVLKRAMIISFPTGIIIFLLANIKVANASLLQHTCLFLNDFGLILGLDGAIILAFLLGLPANEIVIPVLLLLYNGSSMLTDYESLQSLKNILLMHNWTILTAINFLIFSLCHFPCATTLLTIKKETNSSFYLFLSFVIPTIIGICLCFITTFLFSFK